VASGTRIPFAKTRIERESNNDPRRSIEERYANESDYEAAVKHAADLLVKERLLLQGDAESIVRQARERYRSFMSAH
jgi:Alpha/beta hydrolase domain